MRTTITSNACLLCAIMVLMAPMLHAQSNDQPAAIATAEGIFVYLGNQIPKAHYYEVEVNDQRGRYKLISTIKAPATRAEMEERIRTFSPYFGMLTPLTSNDIDKLWQYFSNNTKIGRASCRERVEISVVCVQMT